MNNTINETIKLFEEFIEVESYIEVDNKKFDDAYRCTLCWGTWSRDREEHHEEDCHVLGVKKLLEDLKEQLVENKRDCLELPHEEWYSGWCGNCRKLAGELVQTLTLPGDQSIWPELNKKYPCTLKKDTNESY